MSKQMTGRLKISKREKGRRIDKKEARETQCRVNLVFVKPVLFILQCDGTRGESGEARWREREERGKKAAIFVIAFLASAERKGGKVLRNLNSFDSQGVVVLIFSNREKTPLL